MTKSGTELDISALVNAIERLREGLERHRREPADEQLRDGLIQRFEFTYELSHRMLRRYLRMIAPSPEVYDQMSFQDLIRTATSRVCCAANGRPGGAIRDMRASTSHTYSAAVAQQVVAGIPEFLSEATYLRDSIAGSALDDGGAGHARRPCAPSCAMCCVSICRRVRGPVSSGRARMAEHGSTRTSIWRWNGSGRLGWT